jgi:hypothetical protein
VNAMNLGPPADHEVSARLVLMNYLHVSGPEGQPLAKARH